MFLWYSEYCITIENQGGFMAIVNHEVEVRLTTGRVIYGKVIDEDAFSITLKEGPNPDYSSRPPIIIERQTIETIQLKN